MPDDSLQVADSFTGFLVQFASEPLPPGEPERKDRRPPRWLEGYVIHEKQAVVLGGSPEDSTNWVPVPEERRPELIGYWRRVVQRLARGKEPGGLARSA